MQTKDRVIATLDLPTEEGLRSSLTITMPEPTPEQEWGGFTFHVLKEDGSPVTTLKLTDDQMASIGWAWQRTMIERAERYGWVGRETATEAVGAA